MVYNFNAKNKTKLALFVINRYTKKIVVNFSFLLLFSRIAMGHTHHVELLVLKW